MAKGATINSALSGPFILAPLDNPLTITSTGAITSTGKGNDGVDGSASTAWIIRNKGTVSSAQGLAINLAGAGSLHNSGIVSGGRGGILISGAGQVTNAGTIGSPIVGGSGWGIDLEAGGSVENKAGASIFGNGFMMAGVLISGGVGEVTNGGTISSSKTFAERTPGVDLEAGGSVTNKAGASISGEDRGVLISGGAGEVTNAGTISGDNGYGVDLEAGGTVANKAGASISAFSIGVLIVGGAGAVTNAGTITSGTGVALEAGGTVTNQGAISASGVSVGILIVGGAGQVTNEGTISGGSLEIEGGTEGASAVDLAAGGSVTNKQGGSILGGGRSSSVGSVGAGVQIYGGVGEVTNGGTISGGTGTGTTGGAGVNFEAGGSVTNNKGGSISGGSGGGVGVLVYSGAGVVTNAGTISGGILFEAGTTNNRLIIKPGAIFNGAADATAATDSTIELTRGVGAISGIGDGNFLGFNRLEVDDGANSTLTGAQNTIATVLNDGKLQVAGGLQVSTAVDPGSTGVFKLDTGSTLEVAAALGASSKMSFDSGSELVIDNFGLFGQNVGTSSYEGSLLKNFGGNGSIDLKGFSSAGISSSFSNSGGVLQLQLTNGGMQMASLDFQKSGLGAGAFHFNTDGGSGVLITYS